MERFRDLIKGVGMKAYIDVVIGEGREWLRQSTRLSSQ